MSRTVLAASVAILSSIPVLSAQETVQLEGTVKTVDLRDRSNPPPVMPVSVSVTLAEKAPDGAIVPTDLHGGWFGVAELAGKKVAVAIGKSAADLDAPDRLNIDLDADGKLSKAEVMAIEASTSEQRNTKIVRSKPVDGALPTGVPFTASFMKYGDRAPSATLQFTRYLEATAPAGIVAIVDKDLDGTFGSADDLWTLTQKGSRPVRDYGLMAIGERVFHDGKLYGITVEGNRVTLSHEAATGPDPQDAAAQRARVEHIWMKRFDATRDAFVAQRGLDTSRPLTEKPIDWQYVTFEEAIELGKKANKPVFVDVMAFWCVWCYRMDWSTYPDAEVAKLMNDDFIAVKIIQEQDLVGDYDMLMKEKLKARGIPAMGVFDAEGEPVHTIGGWKKPEDFVSELQAAKKAFANR